MIKPTRVPRYAPTSTSAAYPIPILYKHSKPVFGYNIQRRAVEPHIPSPMASLVQKNPQEMNLPGYKTPFDLKKDLKTLGGIPNGTGRFSGRPLVAQSGIGFENIRPKTPMKNSVVD